jgi:RimJ/RimL family protein N-acetyltransferase
VRLIIGDDDIAAWATQRLKAPIVPPYVCFGVVDAGDDLCGAIVFNSFTGANIEITIYGPGCINRRFIRAAFDYAFNQAGALRLSAHTARANKAMAKVLPRLGFQYEGMMRRYYGPERADDALCFGLLREDAARWMKG